MPAPVNFTLSLSPLPVTFSGSPQDLAQAIVDRLTVAPSVPWSSFLNGSTLPGSDNGPVLYNGTEWRVFDTGLGAYTYHKQNGAGVVDYSLSLAKIAVGTAGSLLVYDGAQHVSQLPSNIATPGQVLTVTGGLTPAWTTLPAAPGATYFEATVAADQAINTNGSVTLVNFDTVRRSAGVTYSTANKRVPVLNGQVWYVYVNLQVEDTGAASTQVQLQTDIRVSGAATGVSTVTNYATAQSRFGQFTGGVINCGADGYFDVAVTATETTPSATGVSIAANSTNTRFGGFRIL